MSQLQQAPGLETPLSLHDLSPELHAQIAMHIDGPSSSVSSFLQTCKWANELKADSRFRAGYLAKQRATDAIYLAFRANFDNATILRVVHWDSPDNETLKHKLLEVLHRAAASGRAELVQEVLQLGKNAGLDANAAASFRGLSDKISSKPPPSYLAYRVFVPDRQSALHRAAAKNHVNVIEALRGWDGIDLNIKEEDAKWTPFTLAIHKGNITAVGVLIAAGADINTRGYKGMTPLQTCVHESNLCWAPDNSRNPPYVRVLEALFAAVVAAPGIDLKAQGSDFDQTAIEMLRSHASTMDELMTGLGEMHFGSEWNEETDRDLYDSKMMSMDMTKRMAEDMIKGLKARGA